MKRSLIILLTVGIIAISAHAGNAVEKTLGNFPLETSDKGARGITVEQKIRNDHPAFIIRCRSLVLQSYWADLQNHA